METKGNATVRVECLQDMGRVICQAEKLPPADRCPVLGLKLSAVLCFAVAYGLMLIALPTSPVKISVSTNGFHKWCFEEKTQRNQQGLVFCFIWVDSGLKVKCKQSQSMSFREN